MHSDESEVNTLSNNFLISFMKTSRDHWSIKDLDSRYVFMNKPSLKFMRCPKGYDVIGKLESEVKLPSSMEYWPEFIALDRQTIESRKIVTNIDVHYYGENNIDTPVAHLCRLPRGAY